MLTKLAFIDLKLAIQRIDIPEWNDCVYIKKLSANQRAQILKNNFKIEGTDLGINADAFADNVVRTCQFTICDDKGVRLFDDSKADFDILDGKDGAILERIFNVVMESNGMTVKEEKEAMGNLDSSRN